MPLFWYYYYFCYTEQTAVRHIDGITLTNFFFDVVVMLVIQVM